VSVTAEECAAHHAFVATLGADAVWRDYISLENLSPAQPG
jgi:hypothetical protein